MPSWKLAHPTAPTKVIKTAVDAAKKVIQRVLSKGIESCDVEK
jgi:hypothetical protein